MAKETTRIFLIRHGDAFNKQGAQFDESHLNAVGKKQAEKLARRLAKVPAGMIFSSPLRRAIETAELVAKKHPKTPVQVKEYLTELYWEFWPELGHFHYDKAHEFEERLEMNERIKLLKVFQKHGLDVLSHLYDEGKGETVFAFTHGNLIRAIISSIMEGSPRGFLSLGVSLASITILDITPNDYRIVTVSDGSHTLRP